MTYNTIIKPLGKILSKLEKHSGKKQKDIESNLKFISVLERGNVANQDEIDQSNKTAENIRNLLG